MSQEASRKPLKTTVTYLEMSERPRLQPPLPVNIHAALMKVENIPLHFYRYLQLQVGRDWNWVYRLRLDDDALSDIVHSPKTDLRVLYVDGAPAGFFELSREDESVVDLAYFGLMQHVRGRGLGKWFLGQAVALAWDQNPSRITVNTNTLDHQIALPLYQKVGFQPVSQTDTFIHPLTEDDYLKLAKSEK